MFESSTNVTTSVSIYPNSGDTWDVLSPFPGEVLREVVVFTGVTSGTLTIGDTCTDVDTNNFTYLRAVTGTNKHVFEANSSVAPTLQTGKLTNVSPGWEFYFTAHDGVEEEEGFVFSNSLINNHGLLHLLPKRLFDVGKTRNEINFLAKTNLQQKTVPTSKGIGGMSKLKDFSFTIAKDYLGANPMDTNDIINMYGRTISLFISDSTGVEDPDDAAYSEIKFKGKISKAVRKDNQIRFIVKGLINSANPLVGGAVVKQSDGSQSNEAILFGDSGDVYVPISKRLNEDGSTSLQFSQDNFIIKSLHVKSGTDKEPIWLDIDTSYSISNNEIILNKDEYSEIFLREALDAPTNQIDRIIVESYFIVGFHFGGIMGGISLSPGDRVRCHYNSGVSTIKDTNSYAVYMRMETFISEDVYFFKCGWEFAFGYLRSLIISFEEKNTVRRVFLGLPFSGVSSPILREIDYAVTYRNNPLEKEVDALPMNLNHLDYIPIAYTEVKERLQEWDTDDRTFQLIPKDPVIIQIEDEKMLVIYTEGNTGGPSSEICPNSPEYSYVWVVRGWDNTTIVSHSNDLSIKIHKDLGQSILATLTRELKGLNTVTPSDDWSFSTNFNDFLNGTKKMTAWNYAGTGIKTSEHDALAWLALDFKLPEITGDLQSVYLVGEAEASVDPGDIQKGNPEGDVYISIALNTLEEGDETGWEQQKLRRRLYGWYVSDDILSRDRYKIAHYSYRDGNVVATDGNYSFPLKTVTSSLRWIHTLSGDAYYYGSSQYNGYDISDYDDLRETPLYFCLNSNALHNKQSVFTFSRPSLKVELKMDIGAVDVYAKVIPKSLFDNPSDEFTIGSNGRICWYPYDYFKTNSVDLSAKNMISISDDDELGFTHVAILPDADFGFITPNPNTDYPGILSKNQFIKYGVSKIYPVQNLKEHYIYPNPPWSDNYVRHTGFPDGLSDDGRSFLENDSVYIWVDQDDNKIKMARKVILDEGNPVSIIQELLTTYFDDVTLDTTSFALATEKRLSWDARLIVKEEKTLVSLIDLVAKEHGLVVYENSAGEIAIIALDPPSTDSVSDDIDDSLLMFKNSDRESLLDFKEVFTDLDYLITEMDVYYNYINNKYVGYIESANLSNQDDFAVSQQFTDNVIKIKLQLQTAFSTGTADRCAGVKMLYHQVPTRFVKPKTTLGASGYDIGGWVTCSGSYITEVNGKIYLILSKGEQVPFLNKKTYIDFTLFEFDWDNLDLRIQEVPNQTITDNYDEVIDTADDIDEVPSA